MVERMIVDDILHWVVDYKVFTYKKIESSAPLCCCMQTELDLYICRTQFLDVSQVDGFRFDLMGHLMTSTMVCDFIFT